MLLNILGMFSCIVISNSQQLFIFDDKLLLGEVYRMSRLRCLSKLKTPKLRKNSLIVAGNQRFGPHSFFMSYIVVRVSTTNNWWHGTVFVWLFAWEKVAKDTKDCVLWCKCVRVPMVSHQFQYADKPMRVSHTPCTMNDKHLWTMVAKQSRLHLRLGSAAAAFKSGFSRDSIHSVFTFGTHLGNIGQPCLYPHVSWL